LERSGILAFHGTSEPKKKTAGQRRNIQSRNAEQNERRCNLKSLRSETKRAGDFGR
jgi:hypothetical protein